MRDALKPGYHAVRGSTPSFDHEQEARNIVEAFKKADRGGINFRNARPYLIGYYRGKKMYFCSDTAWSKGIHDFGMILGRIFEGEGYVNQGLAGHDQYFDLANRVDTLIRQEINPYGKW